MSRSRSSSVRTWPLLYGLDDYSSFVTIPQQVMPTSRHDMGGAVAYKRPWAAASIGAEGEGVEVPGPAGDR